MYERFKEESGGRGNPLYHHGAWRTSRNICIAILCFLVDVFDL